MTFIDTRPEHASPFKFITLNACILLVYLVFAAAGQAQGLIDHLHYAKEFCGEPRFNPETDPGLYLWQDCDSTIAAGREHWFITIAAGGSTAIQDYSGNIQSQLALDHLNNENIEADGYTVLDNASSPNLITFQTSVIDQDIDSFSFTIDKNSPLALLNLDESAALKIYAGENKTKVLAPVDLKRPPIAALPLITIDDVIVNEEERQAEFTVFLSQPPRPGTTVSLDAYTQDASAVIGSDYNSLNTQLTFNSNEVVKKIHVELHNDCQAEPTESFNLVLDNINGATITNNVLSASIVDIDTGYSNSELEDFGYLSVSQFPRDSPMVKAHDRMTGLMIPRPFRPPSTGPSLRARASTYPRETGRSATP